MVFRFDIVVFACFQSIDPERSYDHDVYDELLTQAEIQGNINKVNSQYHNDDDDDSNDDYDDDVNL